MQYYNVYKNGEMGLMKHSRAAADGAAKGLIDNPRVKLIIVKLKEGIVDSIEVVDLEQEKQRAIGETILKQDATILDALGK